MRCMSQSKSSHGEGQPCLNPLCVREVVLSNTSQARPHGIIKGGRKRSDSVRGGDACEIRHLCAPKESTEQQGLNLRVIHLRQQEMGLLTGPPQPPPGPQRCGMENQL
jgi:hypothetical protein